MSIAGSPPLCAITGTNGYLGGCLVRAFLQAGWRVLALSRRPVASAEGLTWAPFELGQDRLPEAATGADALIHCAYDFRPVTWNEITARNVAGTARLLAAARRQGVRQTLVISSISAYRGCRSLYGRAKLTMEDIAFEHGAWAVRPGLIYGSHAGGMYGQLSRQVSRSRLTPIFGRGDQPQYLVHEDDLSGWLVGVLEKGSPAPDHALTAADPERWTFRELLAALARLQHRPDPIFLPVPWRPVWLALRGAEATGLQLGFRSDSLLSLMHQNPRPDFSLVRKWGFQSRPFSAFSGVSS